MQATATTPSRPLVVLVALLISIVYLTWRAGTLGSGPMLWLTVPVFALEALAVVDLAIQAIATGGLRRRGPATGEGAADVELRHDLDVDIAITADSADGVDLERALISAARIRGAGRHRLVVLDRTDRPGLRSTAADAGADYVVDTTLDVAPAAAVHRSTATDLYLWLSTEQVADPAILEATASVMVRRPTAVCQVATWVLNADALAHLERERDDDALVNRVSGPALGRWGVAPWIGPGSIVRRAAIDDVGGFDEPVSTARVAARLHRAGWTTVFEPRALVGTVSPDQVAAFLAARRRQAADAWDLVASTDGPLGRGLTHRARVAQLASALRFTTGLRLALLVVALVTSLVAGVVPAVAAPAAFALLWTVSAASTAVARLILSHGHRRLGDGVRQGWRTVDADLAGLFDVVSGRHRRRRRRGVGAAPPSPPTSSPTGWRAVARFRLAFGAVLLIDAALLLRTATLFDPEILPAFTTGWRIVVLLLAVTALLPIVDVLQVVVRRSQRRRHHRRAAVLSADLDGTPATTFDVTPRGVGVLLPVAPVIGARGTLTVHLPTDGGRSSRVIGDAEVRSVAPDGHGRWRVGLRLTRLSDPAHQALVEYWALGHLGDATDPSLPDEPMAVGVGVGVGQERRVLQSITASAVIGALATVLLGPAAGVAFAAGPDTVGVVCTTTVDGTPVAGVAVERLADADTTPLGVTGGDGCLVLTPASTTTGFALGQRGQTRQAEAAEYGPERLDVVLTRQRIRLVDGEGAPVSAATVRARADAWYPAAPPDDATAEDPSEWLFDTLTPVDQVEITLGGRRHVRAIDGAESTTVVLPRLRLADGATTRVELDDGTGWKLVDDLHTVAPGPVSIRLDADRILRVDLPEGHELVLPAGDVVALSPTIEPAASTTSTTVDREPSSTSAETTTTPSASSSQGPTEPADGDPISTTTTPDEPTTPSEPTTTTTTISTTAASSTSPEGEAAP